ncbi:MAG: 3-hydroxyacyl-CoA dehydrogenase NAD-binding domain-containing protein [bacterium]
MKEKIEKVAVLGAGVMGAQLAAHLSNAGVPSYLFDISQEIAEKGVQAALNLKPAPFYNPRTARLITPCNYEDHLDRLREADWVLEAVVERLDIKQALFKRIEPYLKPAAVVTSNTSGLSIKNMMKGMSADFQQRFLVTHFFNPPRYMRLLEIVSGTETRPDLVAGIAAFCENVLGKGIVYAKDTPNFIANRIGTFGMMLTMKLTREMKLTVEAVDKITGTLVGRPRSASFRTADVVGLDTLAHVARNTYEFCPEDEAREIFKVPDFLQKMLDNGWLGQKTRKGFYQKVDKEILSLNLETLEYAPQKQVRFDGYRVAKGYSDTKARIRALAYSDDLAGKFFWELLAGTLLYAANRIPEIADDIVSVDNAMKWGFGWELGPFETWDAIGVEKSLKRMDQEDKKVPAWVQKMLESGRTEFYQGGDGRISYFDFFKKNYRVIEPKPKEINLLLEKEQGHEIKKNWCASLIDIGDGVACLEFHSVLQPVMNPIDASMIDMLEAALELVPQRGFQGLVIGHQGQNFSAGANLALIIQLCEQKDWQRIEQISKSFQDVAQALKFADFPVVAAPFNLCLGGGYEAAACANRIVAAAELYCGLVEVGVGLIPGAGGNLRVLENNMQAMHQARTGPFPIVQKAFETIGYARVSTSAKEAVKLGYLSKEDRIVINSQHLLFEAKQTVLELSNEFVPPHPREDLILPGEGGRLAIEGTLNDLVKAGKLSAHDRLIGGKLAYVLTGGEKAGPTKPVSEQYILDLEREAFVSLCGEKFSQERMKFMLEHGKPLRN